MMILPSHYLNDEMVLGTCVWDIVAIIIIIVYFTNCSAFQQ